MYGVSVSGQDIYQVDVKGLVVHLGPVGGLEPEPARFTAGDFHPNGVDYYCFDDRNDRLYRIETRDLTAEEIPLSGFPGPYEIADFAFDSQNNMLAYDTGLQSVLQITTSGQVTDRGFFFLGADNTSGAAWVDDDDNLLVYKNNHDTGTSTSGVLPRGLAGTYLLDLQKQTVQQVQIGSELRFIDGAGIGPYTKQPQLSGGR